MSEDVLDVGDRVAVYLDYKLGRANSDTPGARATIELVERWLRAYDDFKFVVGKPWRRATPHDPDVEGVDWSMCDDHVAPIHLYVGGEFFGFVIDAVMARGGKNSLDVVFRMAETYADLLNNAAHDPEWRVQHLLYTLLTDANLGYGRADS